MKLTIEYNDVTSSIELGDFDLQEFKDNLRGLLHTVWLPCQVDEIIPTEEILDDDLKKARRTGYDAGHVDGYNDGHIDGYNDGHTKGYKEGHGVGYQEGVLSGTREPIHCGPAVPRTMDALTETVQKAGLYTDSEQEEMTELRKDKERLDWLLANKYALGPEQDLSNCKHTSAKSYQLIYTRKNIDKAMEEAQ